MVPEKERYEFGATLSPAGSNGPRTEIVVQRYRHQKTRLWKVNYPVYDEGQLTHRVTDGLSLHHFRECGAGLWDSDNRFYLTDTLLVPSRGLAGSRPRPVDAYPLWELSFEDTMAVALIVLPSQHGIEPAVGSDEHRRLARLQRFLSQNTYRTPTDAFLEQLLAVLDEAGPLAQGWGVTELKLALRLTKAGVKARSVLDHVSDFL